MTETMLPRSGLAALARIVVLSAITPLALLAAPALTVQLMAEFALKADQAGVYFLFELGGLSLASLPALWWMRRWPPGAIGLVAACCFIAGNIASVFAGGFAVLCVIRLATAIAGGALMILSLSAAAAMANSDRVFGYWVSGQLILGALALALLPRLFHVFGLDAFFVLLAVLMALALPLARGFAPLPGAAMARATGRGPRLGIVVLAMAILALYYLAVGGTWSFMTVIATGAGIEAMHSADVVAAASIFGTAGALLSAWLGGRIPRAAILLGGYGLLTLAIVLLSWNAAVWFVVAACLFKFAWTFALPPILAVIGDTDKSGAVMSWSNLVIGGANAVAPIIAGHLLEAWGAPRMLVAEAAVTAASCGLVMMMHSRSHRRDAFSPPLNAAQGTDRQQI